MRLTRNPAVDPAAVPAPRADALAFHRGLPGYAPTPVHDLDGVLVKDESDRLGLPAFKILGASWAVERALRERPGADTLVAASAGNHGRAVARAAALRGLRCRIYLPARSLRVRREAIASEGAEVVVVDGGYEEAVARAEADGALLVSDVGAHGPPEWVIDGYATLFAEAHGQAAYDTVVVPVGVGSLAAAAARHGAATGRTVIGAEPDRAACLTASLGAGRPVAVPTPGTIMAGLDCAAVSPAAWPSLRAGIHATVTVSDEDARAAQRALARQGLDIGESGAASYAAVAALEAPGRVLVIATEGPTSRG